VLVGLVQPNQMAAEELNASETPRVVDGLCQPGMEAQLRRQALDALEQSEALVDYYLRSGPAVGLPEGHGHFQATPHLVDWKTF
jgi:hypothetical protein